MMLERRWSICGESSGPSEAPSELGPSEAPYEEAGEIEPEIEPALIAGTSALASLPAEDDHEANLDARPLVDCSEQCRAW